MKYDAKKRKALTQAQLKQLVSYNHNTGIMTRLSDGYTGAITKGRRVAKTGKIAKRISFTIKPYYSYHLGILVWIYVYGKWPDGVIDHIDGNPLNNKVSNLRDVTVRQNCKNSPPYNKQV